MAKDTTLDLGLDDVQAAPKPAKQPLYKGKLEYAPPYYTVNIAHVEHMPEFEVISVNGEAIQLRRGEDVPNVPHAYIEVLKHAVASRQVTKIRPDGTEYYEWVPYPAIPYQIVEGPYQTRKEP